MRRFNKTPVGLLDYTFDWSRWLQSGETIQTYYLTVADGLTHESDEQDDQHVIVWLSGGTLGQAYEVDCEVTTNQGRRDMRSFLLLITEED
jgi:hypothetical protein